MDIQRQTRLHMKEKVVQQKEELYSSMRVQEGIGNITPLPVPVPSCCTCKIGTGLTYKTQWE